jgi:hypothetical protein
MTAIAQEDHVPQPSGRPWSKQQAPATKGAATQIAELKGLVVGYAKQETIDPLKTLGRYLGFGLAGSLMIGTGLSMLLLALLRGLQQIATFEDPSWNWAPYLITGVVGALLVAGFMYKLMKFVSSMSAGTPTTSTPGGQR